MSRRTLSRRTRLLIVARCCVLACVLWSGTSARATLKPDELLLIVNGNVPVGRELAAYYAAARGVPADRIVTLKLPVAEEMEFEAYERWVVPPLRQWLAENDPDRRIRCLVTFHGVPLKLAAARQTSAEADELAEVRRRLDRHVLPRLRDVVSDLEAIGGVIAPAAGTVEELVRRIDPAVKRAAATLPPHADEVTKRTTMIRLNTIGERLSKPVDEDGNVDAAAGAGTSANYTPEAFVTLLTNDATPETRRDSRHASRQAGLLAYARVLDAQVTRLDVSDTVAAFDSELALLLWPRYDRRKWVINPLHHGFDRRARAVVPPVLMTARLDGPSPQIVRDRVAQGVLAERDGLRGRVAIDSRGFLDDKNAYGAFDERLRRLAAFVGEHTPLELVHDTKDAVFAPGSVKDVAVYCGWYSVGNYVPGMTFVPGAVGYHVASFEMTTLRDPSRNEWVKGLLRDGVAATMGPVSEPYLHTFPLPDEFFPLLLTGRLTLAEVYWSTTPLVSWKLGLIGDPLYRPFAVNPPATADALTASLRAVLPTGDSVDAPAARGAGVE